MSNSRWSILTILMLLAAGLTFAQPSQESQTPTPDKHPGMHHEESADQHLQMLSEKLNLTDDQKAKLRPILQDQMLQMKAVREDSSLSQDDRRAKMMDIRKGTDTQIRELLDPTQQKKWDEMQTKRGEWMQHRHQGPDSGSDPQSKPPQQ